MSMESTDWGKGYSGSKGELSEECKPNFEKRINDLKKNIANTKMFFVALETFVLTGPHIVENKNLKSLGGFLHFAIKEMQIQLDRLMEQAEKQE